jgi:hypothetical protein
VVYHCGSAENNGLNGFLYSFLGWTPQAHAVSCPPNHFVSHACRIPVLMGPYGERGNLEGNSFNEWGFKGIVSWDFDGIFIILSYSLYVRQLPLDIFFLFSYLNFIFLLKSLSRLTKTQ